jgi:hypothetical protein
MAPLVGLTDLAAYPAGFASEEMQARARQTILLPAVAMRLDAQALFANPGARWKRIRSFRPNYLKNVPRYPGRDETMPDLQFDAHGAVRAWHDASAEQRALVEQHRNELQTPVGAAIAESNAAYMQTWFEAIAGLVRAQNAPLILFPLPRGPYAELQAPHPAHPVVPTALAGHAPAHAHALPIDLFDDLEQPRYFFDVLHLNRFGRERLSSVLGEQVRHRLASRDDD